MINPDKKFRFREFPVYKKTREFIKETKQLTQKKFSVAEKFNLQSQLFRALDSILLNIAEGAERSTDRDFAHFLNTAHTSVNEVVACFDIALDSNYFSPEDHRALLLGAANLADQLSAFRKFLLRKPKK